MPITFPPAASGSGVTDLAGIPGESALNKLSTSRDLVTYTPAPNYFVAFPAAGASYALFTSAAATSGIIDSIWITCDGGAGSFDARLRIFVDQELVPSFDVDLGTLFVSHGEAHTGAGYSVATDNIFTGCCGTNTHPGFSPTGNQVSYEIKYPVPFGNGIRVDVYTPASGVTIPGGSSLFTQVHLRESGTSTLRLRSTGATRLAPVAAVAASDITFCDLPQNAGSWVYMGLYVFNPSTLGAGRYGYLEKPWLVYTDGGSTPSFAATGAEDLYQAGWYFNANKRFTTPSVLLTETNNTAGSTVVGLDLLKLRRGVKFNSRLKVVWSEKGSPWTTSITYSIVYCLLYYVDTAIPFVPSAPTSVGSTLTGSTTGTVTWAAPASIGSQVLIGYTVTLSPGGATQTVAANVLSANFTGLTTGTAYTPTVVATNSVGNSTGAVGPAFTPASFTVPGTPTIGVATAGNAQASVLFTAPGSNGGSAITGYTATSTPGGFTGTVSGPGSGSITVTGLANGTAYTFTVHATNAIGNSSESAASNSVTPSVSIVLSDLFNRADASTLGNADTGQTWATAASGGTASVGIVGNKAYVRNSTIGGHTVAYASATKADVDITAILGAAGVVPAYGGIVLRYVDINNDLHLQLGGDNSAAVSYALEKKISGAYTSIATISVTPTAGDTVRIVAIGTTIDVYINGTHYGPYTASGISTTSQNVGFQANQSGGGTSTVTWDSISVV